MWRHWKHQQSIANIRSVILSLPTTCSDEESVSNPYVILVHDIRWPRSFSLMDGLSLSWTGTNLVGQIEIWRAETGILFNLCTLGLDCRHARTRTHDIWVKIFDPHKGSTDVKKASSYRAQYPVLRTLKTLYTLLPWQTCSLRYHLNFSGKHPAICYT